MEVTYLADSICGRKNTFTQTSADNDATEEMVYHFVESTLVKQDGFEIAFISDVGNAHFAWPRKTVPFGQTYKAS